MLKKIVKCGAGWCSPCKALEPIFLEVEKEHEDIDFVEINVDNAKGDELDFITANNVRSIPTLFFIDENDKVIHLEVGYIQKNKFNDIINNLTKQNNEAK